MLTNIQKVQNVICDLENIRWDKFHENLLCCCSSRRFYSVSEVAGSQFERIYVFFFII